MRPSSLYQARFWQAGLKGARLLPKGLLAEFARNVSWVYCLANANRREVVFENLLPVFEHDRRRTHKYTSALFKNFGSKLADLWRFESGVDVLPEIKPQQNWADFEKLHQQKRGILLLTPHLGNWEFGAPLLAAKGIKLQVITQPEPGGAFTEMRQKARARWGIETVVVGNDAFAFIEVVRRLDAGAVVALLVDRPPAPSAVTIELFGRPFQASIAPAELARATGCALLPVMIPKVGRYYEAILAPEISYDRATLGNREARRRLTQEIMSGFEGAIRQYGDQWYHFVPIWT